MISIRRYLVSTLIAPLCLSAAPLEAQQPREPIILTGRCLDGSNVGSGSSQAELDRHGVPFRCDSAIVTAFPRDRMLIQFTRRGDEQGGLVGFAGETLGSGEMNVDHLYLNDGRTLTATKGHCVINADSTGFHSFVCGARVERGDLAVAAVVAFDVEPTRRRR